MIQLRYLWTALLLFLGLSLAHAQSSVYCRYCFEFKANSYSGTITVSNVFVYPARLDYGTFFCYDELQLARKRRQEKINEHAEWATREVEKKDDCNAYQEQQRVKAEEFQRARQLEEEKRLAKAREEEARRQQALAVQKREAKKEATLEYYRQLAPKPQMIPDGWYECTVIYLLGGVETGRRFHVRDNRVVEAAKPHLPQYDNIWAVSSGPITEGSVKVSDGEDLYDVLFLDYIQDRKARAETPVQDERALWWLEGLNDYWQSVISGGAGGQAFAGDPALDFDKSAPSRENLGQVSRATRIELDVAGKSRPTDPAVYGYLLNSRFTSLQNAELILKGNGYQIRLASPALLKEHSTLLYRLIYKLNDGWRALLSGRKENSYGILRGEFPVPVELYDVQGEELEAIATSFQQATRLNLPPDMVPGQIPAFLFPNLLQLDLRGNRQLSWQGLKRLPDMPRLQYICACDTEAAVYWYRKMRSRKKKRRFVEEMRAKYPRLERVEFCSR